MVSLVDERQRLKTCLEALDPCKDLLLDRRALLQVLKDIDPEEEMWNESNVDIVLESASLSNTGMVHYHELLSWVFSDVSSNPIVVNVTLPPGEDVLSVPNAPDWTGDAVKVAVSPVVQVGQELREFVFNGQTLGERSTAATLGMKTSSTLRPLLRETSPHSDRCQDWAEHVKEEPVPTSNIRGQGVVKKGVEEISATSLDKRPPTLMQRRRTRQNSAALSLQVTTKASNGECRPALTVASFKDDAPILESQLSRKDQFMKQLAESSNDSSAIEPMTDTRHNVKAWGKVTGRGCGNNSLWSRRKAEMTQIKDEQASLSVEALKVQKLSHVPESPKRIAPGRRSAARHRSTFDPIPEDAVVEPQACTPVVKERKRKPKDPNRFLSECAA